MSRIPPHRPGADSGHAEYTVVPAAHDHSLPAGHEHRDLAPLPCAGIIGYRALRRAFPPEGGRLGVYGFGGSAHPAAQVARRPGAPASTCSRGANGPGGRHRNRERPPPAERANPLPNLWTPRSSPRPSGDPVPVASAALDRGGVLSPAGIHLGDVPPLNHRDHLFQEREPRGVTPTPAPTPAPPRRSPRRSRCR
ncbi:hypothetical protein [Nocardiopsis sp. N85]|uniref:hypothetical protein n=1 Tax=Nocardiopsis sp. N85 TaxID=3029400 RepID=UPI0031583439